MDIKLPPEVFITIVHLELAVFDNEYFTRQLMTHLRCVKDI